MATSVGVKVLSQLSNLTASFSSVFWLLEDNIFAEMSKLICSETPKFFRKSRCRGNNCLVFECCVCRLLKKLNFYRNL